MTGALNTRLNRAKWECYSVVQKYSNSTKGDIRAFVALKTWEYETGYSASRSNKVEAHVTALEDALDDYRSAAEDKRVDAELSSMISKWRRDGRPVRREPGGDTLLSPPVSQVHKWKGRHLNLVSLFSGAFGLDLGFMAAGFTPRVALDIDDRSQAAIRANLPDLPFITRDVSKVPTAEILDKAGLGKGDVDLVVGGPPCQPFSTAGRRKGLNDPRASPLREFVRFVKEARPRCFVMEEVEGIGSSRLNPEDNGEGAGTIGCGRGSAFHVILDMLRGTGYKMTYDLLNAADYGSPQFRRRYIFIGSRERSPRLPTPTHSGTRQSTLDGKLQPWNTFFEATVDLQGADLEHQKLGAKRSELVKLVPPGGNWRHLPGDAVRAAMGGAYGSGGGKMGYFRRLTWDSPSPTVVTSPVQKSTMLCHPEELRGLNVPEYKRIQGFPDDWEIPGNTAAKYLLIGNAVPVHLSFAVATEVRGLLDGRA